RQWLIEHNFMNEPGQTMPEITDEYAESVSERYIELYEHIVGEKFDKAVEEGDIAKRIEKNVAKYLASK
ncbi:MAG: phosphoribosylaminoimidazolesuccinocarboxamide synthase, partial [Prevotella sp.]|nr:phosphoribosylaminoimidazolesuccinocarboxamide synthase [Prevotella sp.]